MKTLIKYINSSTGTPSDCGDPLVIEQSSRNLNWHGILLEKGYSPYFYPSDIITPYFYFALGIEAELNWRVKVQDSMKSLKTSPGEIWINPPGVPFTHSIDEICYFIILTIDEQVMLDAFPGKLPKQSLEFLNSYNIDDETIRNIINIFYAETLNNGRSGDVFITTLLRLLSNYYIHNFSNYLDLRNKGTQKSAFKKRNLDKIQDYILEHIGENIKIDDLADLVSKSKFSFLKEFKNETGITPYQYILKIKMDYAEHLLKTTDDPIAKIAYELAFVDQSHFTNMFKRYFSVSPGKYR